MEFKINISDETMKRLKDFGLSGIFKDVVKDMERFDLMSDPKFFRPTKMTPLEGIRITSKTVEKFKDGKRISREDFEEVEELGKKTLRKDLAELFNEKSKREIYDLVLERLNPHQWALLVQEE